MGQQFSYDNNDARKMNGWRYDTPSTKEYNHQSKKPIKECHWLIKPRHPITTTEDLKRATFKSLCANYDSDLNHTYLDSIFVSQTTVIPLFNYEYYQEKLDEVKNKTVLFFVKQFGHFYVNIMGQLRPKKDKITIDDEYVLIVAHSPETHRQIEKITTPEPKRSIDGGRFEIIYPFRTAQFYRNNHTKKDKHFLVHSMEADKNLKKIVREYFNLGDKICGVINVVKIFDDHIYKKTTNVLNTDDGQEMISIDVETEFNYDRDNYRNQLANIGKYVLPLLGDIVEPPKYSDPTPNPELEIKAPPYSEVPTPSAPKIETETPVKEI